MLFDQIIFTFYFNVSAGMRPNYSFGFVRFKIFWIALNSFSTCDNLPSYMVLKFNILSDSNLDHFFLRFGVPKYSIADLFFGSSFKICLEYNFTSSIKLFSLNNSIAFKYCSIAFPFSFCFS